MSMVEAIEKAVTIKHKPTPSEKAERERRRFCSAARKMLDQISTKNSMLDALIAREQERAILTGVSGMSDFSKHRNVLETLRLAVLETKRAFNCGD
jgi:hypothetical protein